MLAARRRSIMASQPTARRWTYEEFSRLPENGNRHEVIAGRLYVTPAPKPRHQRIVTALVVALESQVRQHGLGWVLVGPIDVLFDEGDYLEPDLVFVRRGRQDVVSERGIEAPPDLVVEVLSPSTAIRDRTLKRDRYRHFGVPEYWVVDPDALEVVVHRAEEDPHREERHRERFLWHAWPGAPAVEVDVPALFRTLD
jgi:Uma2 family endonuclease